MFKIRHDFGPRVADPRALLRSDDSVPPGPVHRTRKAGYRLPPNTVSVCRPFLWGNLFTTAAAYRVWLETGRVDLARLLPKYRDEWYVDNLKSRRSKILERLPELRGKNLACFCKLPENGQPDTCHRAVLLELANAN